MNACRYPALARMTVFERCLAYAFLGVVIGFGILVEVRSVALSRRMGDLDVYLRSAWAAHVGEGIYDVADSNGWHYSYPPFLALVLIPLADPPYGEPPLCPYPLSVAIVYVLNIALLFASAHILASAIEGCADDPPPRFCRRWWALRLWPIVACLPPAAQTAMRGQVNHLVLALLCLAAVAIVQRQRLRGGFWLALAICIKVIPAFLLVYPLWRRDGRMLFGCAAGLFLGLVVLPVAVLGPQRAVQEYQRYTDVFFRPALGLNDDRSRHDELLGVNKTDSIGIRDALHNWSYPDLNTRPTDYPPAVVWGHRILAGLMTLLVLLPGSLGSWRARLLPSRLLAAPTDARDDTFAELQKISALILLMAILSPICHLHYMVFALPLVLCLMAKQWQGRPTLWLRGWFVALLLVFVLANSIPSLPHLDRLKDLCVDMLGVLPLWVAGIGQLWSRERQPAPAAELAGLAAY